ncbi:glycosyltransferase [Microbulbifer thermotolerans]|uniref:glycosyltransferase family 2 protein n=1 Tax=Microbulbifer thermotolerans TaxID=252514 RepID=UPI00224B22C9|nr:glycosyltransferase family 2 protein [Microbulbifer thermotolerans]MCX2840253.1 glycosyltransferase [Microbulbifer thermotolerans]
MNVFVLCAGRCGSVTFFKACQKIANFTCGHESTSGLHADKRFNFPDYHIEVDNRLAWMLGYLESEYGDSAIYVHLSRNPMSIARSYNQRWHTDLSIIKAYTHGILKRDSEGLDDCIDYVGTVEKNIKHFLKDKSKVVKINAENFEQDFTKFWEYIGAKGDFEAAIKTFQVHHNYSTENNNVTLGGNHSFISRKQLFILKDIQKTLNKIVCENDFHKSTIREIAERETSKKLKSEFDSLLKISQEREKELKKILFQEQERLKEIEQSLAYCVGKSFERGIGSGWIKYFRLMFFPIYILKGIYHYSNIKKSNLKEEKLKPLHDELLHGKNKVELKIKKEWPTPLRSNLAWCAMILMNKKGIDEALSFLDCYCKKDQEFIKTIFSANKDVAIGDDESWLKKINRYLGSYNLNPISLRDSNEYPDFLRIYSDKFNKHEVFGGAKISVIMPAYNAESTVKHAICSILNQTWKNLELIIIDDCSTDRTWAVVQEMAQIDSRIKAIKNHKNVGPYVSKNIGLKFVTGDYLTGHDADDWAHPQRLQRQIEPMLQDPNIKVNVGCMIRMAPDRTIKFFSKIGKMSPDGVARLAYISCMFRTSEFKQYLGSWDCVRFAGDSELIERSKIVFGKGFVVNNFITMICLDAEGSLTNDPKHGVNKISGISASRVKYRNAWLNWHKKLTKNNAVLEFPPQKRRFSAPKAAEVSIEDILLNLKSCGY